MAEIGVVALALAVRVLVLLAEVAAAAFLAGKRVAAHQFAELEEVGHAAGLFEGLVERVGRAGHADVRPEFLAQRRDLLQRLFEPLLRARHAAEFPHELAEALVIVAHRLLPLVGEEALVHRGDVLFRSLELHAVGARTGAGLLRSEVVADRVRNDEITVGEALHQRARAKPVGAVIGEVRLAEHEQARDVRHQVIVHPQPAHRVVHGGKDAHRGLVGALGGDLVVDVEEIAVALAHPVLA